MSQITDFAAMEQAALAATSASLDGIVAGVLALDAMIVAFQNTPAVLTPADQAALDAITSVSSALVAKAAAVSTTPPSSTPPPPPPPPPTPEA